MKLQSWVLLVPLGVVVSHASAFVPPPQQQRVAFARRSGVAVDRLHAIIKGDSMRAEVVDTGMGGVRLAMESAIKILGTVKHNKKKKGNSSANAKELLRYTQVTKVEESAVKDVMEQVGATVICTGVGKELYKDPGETTMAEVTLAPADAVRDALSSVPNASVSSANVLVVNFLGGDDLMIGEVLDASVQLVEGLDVSDKAKILFNSLCQSSFPKETVTVTAVATSGDDAAADEGKAGAEKSVAAGEVYFSQGAWWTVVEEDINPAAE